MDYIQRMLRQYFSYNVESPPSCSCSSPFLPLAPSFSSNETDHEPLLAFEAATKDPSNSLSSWNSSLTFCRWRGVACSTTRQRVTGLNLVNLTLSGSITPHLGNLTFLRLLNLNNNSYAGKLGRLRRIQHISLSNNLIQGELPPTLANCTNLLSLVVSYNRLRGALPLELGSLSKLELFSIIRNALSGAIPDTLGNLSSLTGLYCGLNDLSGSLPASLGRLARLELLAFGENVITGVIPPSVFNLSKITVFDLAANQIRGSLPSDLASVFPSLDFFSVGINMLEGSIPPSLSNATSLRYIHVGYNQLTGEVPSFMKLNKLTVLALSGKMLGRGGKDLSFVASLKNATNLVSLGLDGNGFGGELHPAF
ncbi:putative receptor-like protein kinase At3g47110 [Salvia splendens]|uniref:putative receptor-like protein kinase At3g47110 n=1 Tax=Salvia splendens TaxID=180675 RepID=UPI001C263741|nr:putative receptor-like protein kinase At3g47110 [Salvia splendens]